MPLKVMSETGIAGIQPDDRTFDRRDIWQFGALLLLFSSVFYVGGPLLGSLAWITRSNVPAAALMFVCPAIAAFIIAHHRHSAGDLANRLRRPSRSWWWIPAIALMPAVIIFSSLWSGVGAVGSTSWSTPIVLALVYLVSALGEEIGWTGFALPRMFRLFGELPAALLLGSFWSLWHVIPYLEAGNSGWWILGQCLFTILFRVILVRLTVLTGKTIWPAVVCHAAYNWAWSLSPGSGSHYLPWLVAIVSAVTIPLLFIARPRRAQASPA